VSSVTTKSTFQNFLATDKATGDNTDPAGGGVARGDGGAGPPPRGGAWAARPPPPSPPNPPPPTPTHAHPSRATPLENVSKKDWHIPVGMVWGRSAGCPELHKVCKVSVLVYFLYKLTMYRTFENFLPTDCRHRCKSRQILFLFISYFF
jgi:hypothetical protein